MFSPNPHSAFGPSEAQRKYWPCLGLVKRNTSAGFSAVELIVAVAIIGVLTALAIPQLAATRRLTRSVAVTRQLMTQMRYARQLAMSQRQAFTFSYDNATKQIKIINNNASGTTLLSDGNYPENAGSTVIATIPLTTGGLSASDISYGVPTGLPTGASAALGDGVSPTALSANKFNVTFQPDGSVVNTAGNPSSAAMYIYNDGSPQGTASAISVLGSTGRIKVWRYSSSASKYAE